jgi:bacteriorhodopsin
MVKAFPFLGLFFTGISLVTLLGFIARAFPQFSGGTNVILIGVFLAFFALSLVMMVLLKANKGVRARPSDFIAAGIPGFLGCMALGFVVAIGVYIASQSS